MTPHPRICDIHQTVISQEWWDTQRGPGVEESSRSLKENPCHPSASFLKLKGTKVLKGQMRQGG